MLKRLFCAFVFLLGLSACSWAAAGEPILCFTDITSGPRTGNSDTSLGQTADADGAIVTVWGKNLGDTQAAAKVMANGAEARVYSWGKAKAPADLSTRHQMQMVSFQIARAAADGVGSVSLEIDGKRTNELPFTVREGRIYFVKTTGDDNAEGDWNHPFKTIPQAVKKSAPGDILYVCDGVNHTTGNEYNAVINLSSSGEPGKPKALVAYPGATCRIGSTDVPRGFGHWVPGKGLAEHWTLAKFTVTAGDSPFPIGTGYRVVGNFLTAPKGNGATGAIEGSGNDMLVLGNEITKVGKPGCSKLYHPVYISSVRTNTGPRRPAEANREIAWNYFHDNDANRAINIYSEQSSTAFMSGHKVHDNFIANQVGDGILIGRYTTGENWIYNNVIANAGQGPDPGEGNPVSHFGVNIDAGHEESPGTVIHFFNNTLYGCGWAKAAPGSTGSVHILGLGRYELRFRNNIIYSTGEPYLSRWSDVTTPPAARRNLWFGKGAPPAWDTNALSDDPKFADAKALDFHLLPDSPALTAGLETEITRDFDGRARAPQEKPALGAYGRQEK